MSNSKFKNSIRDSLRNTLRIPLLYAEWLKERITIRFFSARRSDTMKLGPVLIITPDPRQITGSKGDEAMIFAVIEMIRKNQPDRVIGIISGGGLNSTGLRALGVVEEPCWANPWSLKKVRHVIQRYHSVLIVGADVMDGFYSAVSAARLWVAVDLGARLCKHSAVLGFSFNTQPSFWLKPFIRGLDWRTKIYLRDDISWGRFSVFSNGRGELVADSAFLLVPRTNNVVIERISAWIDIKRTAGKAVVAFNIHPMLFRSDDVGSVNLAMSSSIRMIETVVKNHQASVLLVSHDYRPGGLGETGMLESIYKKLSDSAQSNVMFFDDQLHAAELKGIAGLVDAVVTGRMHFAIAALGQGVPVAAITYQGKFDGLFKHFLYPSEFLISPSEVTQGDSLERVTIALLAKRDELKTSVTSRLPAVHTLARNNVSSLGFSVA